MKPIIDLQIGHQDYSPLYLYYIDECQFRPFTNATLIISQLDSPAGMLGGLVLLLQAAKRSRDLRQMIHLRFNCRRILYSYQTFIRSVRLTQSHNAIALQLIVRRLILPKNISSRPFMMPAPKSNIGVVEDQISFSSSDEGTSSSCLLKGLLRAFNLTKNFPEEGSVSMGEKAIVF